MDAVSVAASILAIAGAGIQVSLKLIAFADQVGTAPERIRDVGTDVSVTAGTLRELGELMKKKTPSNKSSGIFKPDQVENVMITSIKCEHIFDELKKILGRASQQLRKLYNSTSKNNDASSKIKLSSLERMRWPFLQPSIQPLRSALGDAKATLTLLLQVVHLRYAHVTANLDKEEQNDLIRMIAAMRRQQLASMYGGGGGDKGLEVSDSEAENSDSSGRAEVETALEAWSVTPNTLSDSVLQHLIVTPIPVSQQQIEKILRISPQDLREVSSIIDSLSSPERDVIFGNVLRHDHSNPGDSTIRSISRENWTGSHVLFGKVTSRKFRLIIERRVEKARERRAKQAEKEKDKKNKSFRRKAAEKSDSESDSDDLDEDLFDSLNNDDDDSDQGGNSNNSHSDQHHDTNNDDSNSPDDHPDQRHDTDNDNSNSPDDASGGASREAPSNSPDDSSEKAADNHDPNDADWGDFEDGAPKDQPNKSNNSDPENDDDGAGHKSTEAYTHDPRVSPSPKTPFGTTADQTRYQARKRTKTGCLTCRKRRIKCGEERPTCKNCVNSKRECEGYVPRVVFKDPHGAFKPAQQGDAAGTQRPARETVQVPAETCEEKSSKRRTKPSSGDKTSPHNAGKEDDDSEDFLTTRYTPSRSWTEPQSATEISDNQLVKDLLAEYTNFELGEPLVQSNVTPPPTYDEVIIAPKRTPRPY